MKIELLAIAMTFIPGIALWLCTPKRIWPMFGGLVGNILVGGAMIAIAPNGQEIKAEIAALGAILACVVGIALTLRRKNDHLVSTSRFEAVKEKRAEISKTLASLKARGVSAEREHTETMAVYGMVKGLAEALSWEDARPRIEAAFEQYFGSGIEFALYVSGLHGDDQFRPLSLHGLRTSPGSTWATLQRMLVEQGAQLHSARIFERPERAVGIPIHEGQELLGYLYARIPEKVEVKTWSSKAQIFASELVMAFKRVKLFQEMERLSEIDGLTGLHRRGAFDKRIAEEAVRAKTFKTTFGLMLLDIDHFKSLNDRYGHPFGDQVLKSVGATLNRSVYETDYVARYGGEEFVVLLPRAEVSGALRRAEAIRAAVEAESFVIGFETVKVTVSIGIAHFPRDAQSPEELIARADAAMYAAKSAGRNRVIDCQEIAHG